MMQERLSLCGISLDQPLTKDASVDLERGDNSERSDDKCRYEQADMTVGTRHYNYISIS